MINYAHIGEVLSGISISTTHHHPAPVYSDPWETDEGDWDEYYAELEAELEYMETYGFCEKLEESFRQGKMSIGWWQADQKEGRKCRNAKDSGWKRTTKARYQFDRRRRRAIKQGPFGRSFEISSKGRMASLEVCTPYEELTEEKPERFSNDPCDASFWDRECFMVDAYRVDDEDWFYNDGRPDVVAEWRDDGFGFYENHLYHDRSYCGCYECEEKRWQEDYLQWAELDSDFWYSRRVCDDHDYHNEAWDVDHCHNDDYYYDYDDDYYAMVDKDRELIILWECDDDMRKPRPVTRHDPDPIPDHELEPEDLPQFRHHYLKRPRPIWEV